MSRAGGNAHDTAQAFLNERERGVVDIDRSPPISSSTTISPESRTIFRITYGSAKIPDAMVRYALASSSKFTSDAPNAVVA